MPVPYKLKVAEAPTFTLPAILESYRGKNVGQFCPFSLGKDNKQSHCAHFVSHVMGYEFEETCKNQTSADKQMEGNGATLRVNKIFNACTDADRLAHRPVYLTKCLVFVTLSKNVYQKTLHLEMGTHVNKHIGIYVNGMVWHYSNGQGKVVADSELRFIDKFTHAYLTAGQTVEFFYGSFLK